MWIYLLYILAALVALTAITSSICFFKVFSYKQPDVSAEDSIPLTEDFNEHRSAIINWIKQAEELPYEEITITSYDGLRLYGRLYEYTSDAPIEILFHGYKGSGLRDMSGGIERCFAIGRSALIVDQRACGRSEGRVVTFGIKERYDCLNWANYLYDRFGISRKVIITGVSMGAATVMLASSMNLPENVVSALADCGYTSGKEIIKKVIRDMKLPANLLYPFVRIGSRLFGKFDIDEVSPIESVKESKIPIAFIHGLDDDFVPCDMSIRLYEECSEKKALLTVPGSGHGLAYPTDKDGYVDFLRSFEKEAGFLDSSRANHNVS